MKTIKFNGDSSDARKVICNMRINAIQVTNDGVIIHGVVGHSESKTIALLCTDTIDTTNDPQLNMCSEFYSISSDTLLSIILAGKIVYRSSLF